MGSTRTSKAPSNVRAGAVQLEPASIPEIARGIGPESAMAHRRAVAGMAGIVRRQDA